MIKDKDLNYNMALYMALMQQKYESVKEKRKQLQKVLYDAASKIQKIFRMHQLKKKTRAAMRLQRWWRRNQRSLTTKNYKIEKFNRFYYGKYCSISPINPGNLQMKKKIKNKAELSINSKNKKRSILKIVNKVFPPFIARKSALFAESKYIVKYQQYLRQKFESDWQAYQKKLTKQLWKQINKKWVKIDKLKGQNRYLNEQDKEVDADEYINRKLNGMYEQFHGKLQNTENSLKSDHQQIIFALKVLQSRYEETIAKEIH